MTTSQGATASAAPRGGVPRSPGATVVMFTRQTWAGARVLLAFTLLLGVVYPLAVTGVGQLAFPWQANGSLLTAGGERATSLAAGNGVIGSALIGQASDGPEWFRPRPSAAGSGYDTLASASGLDPDIAPAYARLQVARVAATRGLSVDRVAALVEGAVQGRTLGLLGEPRVNVLRLNLALVTMGS